MSTETKPTSLTQLLDQIEETTETDDQVSVDDILDLVGRRSFGPLLLLAGVITLLPIVGDIPGVPTLMATIVILIAGQLLFHREHLWLPNWLLNRSVAPDKLQRSIEWMRTPAQYIDRWLQPRLEVFTDRTATYTIAIASMAIAAMMPLMEFIPFSANLAGAALTAFGLALIAQDGLLAIIAFVFTAVTFGLVGYNFL